jgi:hypothetical protein
MKISKAHTTMKSILKVKTKSFIENYKQNKLKNTLKKNDINIVEDDDKKIKKLIKEGTLTDNLLVDAIKNVMRERIKHG